MATAPPPVDTSLQELAQRHLWMHFSRMGSYGPGHEIPIIVRAEGCYVYDEHGKRYLDGLSGLFCVNAGHGRTELGEAAARQVEELDFYTLWSYAHPRAIELADADRLARPRRPQPRLLHLRRLGGGRVGAEAGPQLPPDPRQRPEAQGDRARDRLPRHFARRPLRHRHHRAALPVRAADAGRLPRPQHQPLPLARGSPPALGGDRDRGADPVRGPGDGRRGDPRAGPERRRLLRPARGLLRARARDLRPLRRADDLRRGDLRLGPARPLLRLRSLRLRPRHHHRRQGADLRLRADGRDDRLRPRRRALPRGRRLLRPWLHLRRPPARLGDRDGQPRHLRARGPLRPRPRQGGRVPPDAGEPARAPDRRRRARRRLLPGDRAGQGQGDEGELRRRGVRGPAARLPLRRALQARPDLPRRRSRRPGNPAGATADRGHGAIRRDPRRALTTCSPRPGSGSTSRAANAHRPEPARRARPRPGYRGAVRPGRRCAGSTSPSWRTRPPGSPAAS